MSAGNEGQRYRREHDPYNGMEEAEIRPSNIARQELSDAEKSATKEQQSPDSPSSYSGTNLRNRNARFVNSGRTGYSSSELRSLEQNMASNSFRNSVTGRRGSSGKSEKVSAKGGKSSFKKRLAPATLITMLLCGGGALFYFSQSFLGPQLSSLYTDATDIQFTSYNARNARLFKYMLDGGDQVKISNFTKKYTTFSPYMKKRLNKYGIEVGHIDADGKFKSGDLISTKNTVLKYNGEIIDANSFQTKFANDAGFRDSYYKAKRGRVAGFFDDSADHFYKKKGATRDIFDQYKSSGDADTDAQNFRDTVSDRVTGTESKVNTVSRTTDEETGESVAAKNGDDLETKNISGDTPEAKARTMVNSIAGKVSNAGVPICSALRIANMAAVTVSAYQIFQSISYFLSFMEPISKTMAGEGDASGINEALNFLTTETTSQVQYVNSDGSTITKDVTGSPLQSTGAKLVLGDTLSSREEVAPYSIKNVTRAATTVALSTGATNTVCDGVMAASAIMSLASSAVPGGTLAKFIVSAVAQTVGGVALTGIVAAVVNTIIPYVAKVFAGNLFENYTGIPAGELFSQGAATSNFKLATQSSAYMPASEEYIKEQNHQTSIALAQEAEIERKNHSPFDISNRHTFLGSIVSKFSFLARSNTLFNQISNFATTLTKSLFSLNPSASAYDTDVPYTSVHEECTDGLSDTTCGSYDEEIVAMDYSTIDLSPDDPTYTSVIEPNLDADGNIKDDSELATFINVCTERESPWGVLDAGIMSGLQTSLGTIGDNIPFVESAIDIINAAEDIANRDWGTGERCKMSSENPYWNSTYKYYQRYIEDMRILSSMDGEEDSNPVIAYKNKYDKTHPVDNSFAGALARISGQSKDDIAFLLEYIDYSTKIANYDPSTRYAFVHTDPSEPFIFSNEQPDFQTSTIPSIADIFIDRRNYTV